MSLLTMRSFGEKSVATAQPTGWAVVGGTTTYTTGRFTGSVGASFGGGGGSHVYTCPTTNDETRFTLGFAVKPGASIANNVAHFFTSGLVPVVSLSMDADSGGGRRLRLMRGSGTANLMAVGGVLVGAAAGTIPLDVWAYIEMQVTFKFGAVFDVEVRVDEAVVMSYTGVTGGPATPQVIAVGITSASSAYALLSDVYVTHSEGTSYMGYLGDCQAIYLAPVTGGSQNGLTGSDGNTVNNYLQVDEVPHTTADYNGSGTLNARDMYKFTPLVGFADTLVYGVRAIASVFKSDAGAAQMKAVIQYDAPLGTYNNGPPVALSTTMLGTATGVLTKNQAGSAFLTVADVNLMEIGAQVTV